MSAHQERMHILGKIADREITAEEGAKRLRECRKKAGRYAAGIHSDRRWLRVLVSEGKPSSLVRVQLPVGLIREQLNQDWVRVHGQQDATRALKKAIQEGAVGKVYQSTAPEHGSRVEIYLDAGLQ